jgi:hypothetical protein
LSWGKNDAFFSIRFSFVLDFERANSHRLEEVAFSLSLVFAFPGQRRTSGFEK